MEPVTKQDIENLSGEVGNLREEVGKMFENQTTMLLGAMDEKLDEKLLKLRTDIKRDLMDFKSDLYGTFVKKEDLEHHIAAGHA